MDQLIDQAYPFVSQFYPLQDRVTYQHHLSTLQKGSEPIFLRISPRKVIMMSSTTLFDLTQIIRSV